MTRFPPAFLDALKARVSIVDVVGRRLTWDPRKSQPRKGDMWACCPFHGERTPSFHVMENRGAFYCFGCHEKGGAIDFVMKIDRLSFPEAVERLAEDAGMALPAPDPRAAAIERRRRGLHEAMEAAVTLFRAALYSAAGRPARDYLAGRGVGEAAIERFELGFAPAGGGRARDVITKKLLAEGFDLDTLIEADLARPPENGRGAADSFYARVMFPIRDARGRCIAFGARTLAKDVQPKYLNSRETPLFSKGRSLYNIGPARDAAAKGAPLVVVEGYMDVIALDGAGVHAAVAPLGTALTEEQLALLWKMAPEPVIALDGDEAGKRAAARAADLATPRLEPGRSLRFAWTPEGLDPDDLVRREGGAAAFHEALAAAEPLVEFAWRRERDRAPLDTPERKAALEEAIGAFAARILHPSVRKQYVYALRGKMFELFRGASRSGPPPRPNPRGGPQGPRSGPPGRGGGRGPGGWSRTLAGPTPETLRIAQAHGDGAARAEAEAAVLALLLAHPSLVVAQEAELEAATFCDARLDSLRAALISAQALCEDRGAGVDRRALVDAVERVAGAGALDALWRRVSAREEASLRSAELAACKLADLFRLLRAPDALAAEVAELADTPEPDFDTDGVFAQARLREALKLTAVSGEPGAVADEEDDYPSDWLQSFRKEEPWIRRSKRSDAG